MIVVELKQIRQAKKMSIRKLSQLSGVGTTEIWNIENCVKTPKIDTLFNIAKAFGLTLNDLVKEVNADDYCR